MLRRAAVVASRIHGFALQLVGCENHHETVVSGAGDAYFNPNSIPVHNDHPMTSHLAYPSTAAAAVSADATGEEFLVTMLPAVPDTVGYAGAFTGVIGHRLFAGGGANFPDGVMPWAGGKKVWHDTLYMLDLSTPEAGWKIIGRLPNPNGYGVSVNCREGIVLIGGGDAVRHFREVWLLTLAADGLPVFRSLPGLPSGLALMSGALVGRCIHLCGGIGSVDAAEATGAHWSLDLDAPEEGWRKLPELPAAGRILATAASLDGAFHLIGGCALAPDANGKPVRKPLRETWKFSAGRWSRIADLPHALVASGSPAPVAGNSFFLVSGDDGRQSGLASPEDHSGFSREVLRYDADRDSWTSVGMLAVPPPVTVAVTPWQDGFIFFNGEVRPGVRTPQVFSFEPPQIFAAYA
jgi:N-acetylneuraminic acid mutarotase